MVQSVRLRVALVAALLASLSSACRGADEIDAPEVGTELTRTIARLDSLAFVPGGRTSLVSPLDVGVSVDLFVDRYEVTVGEWRRLFDGADPIPPTFRDLSVERATATLPGSWRSDVPVVGMTLAEARRAAELRGMRLPTFEEWMWCATGPRSRRLPAGRRQRGLANTLELGLFRATPVGAFESGQTPDTGIYDLLGNVWEWTEMPTLVGWTATNPDAWPADGGAGAPAWIAGGSFATPERVLFTRDRVVHARATTVEHRGFDVGMRCVAEAWAYLDGLPDVDAID
ncbi:MAG: SUMF1/EgtB/PvdO family nonheme iron enzyme, partial [Planctomycetota bacterium]